MNTKSEDQICEVCGQEIEVCDDFYSYKREITAECMCFAVTGFDRGRSYTRESLRVRAVNALKELTNAEHKQLRGEK